jgi:hypothetical protein
MGPGLRRDDGLKGGGVVKVSGDLNLQIRASSSNRDHYPKNRHPREGGGLLHVCSIAVVNIEADV